ncbi:hypothetical protein C2869_03215 [Saccharobesus litoralis]|uniref:Uncharacterized protein n=1 Tax=Saccharobesus litoralis TaxID=2172099 RepID=A0A2S0VMQ2_9ALTE|nr:hypothetical protein [Saccharobesus litoralis]AWB65503.1 hypothetical protein C2869_03215 [Saccharobesus litoralis]
MKYLLAVLLIISSPFVAAAEENSSSPQIKFLSIFDDDISYDLLKKSPLLANLAKEEDAPGCPIVVAAWYEQAESGASGAVTGLLSASTLGLVPVVRGKDFTIKYKIRVNGNTVSEYEYKKSFVDTEFLFAMEHGLTDKAKVWVVETVDLLLADLEKDQKFAELLQEYQYYFGS